MKQTAKSISTYSADVFGVASALFELGGMTVIHDASGCNSTYTTHDEPRWYDMESMVFISAVTEMEALMGDDEKLFRDIAYAAKELNPGFIAIAGTPIPMMTGFDYDSAARLIEQRTGIKCFAFNTSGMEDYSVGISKAFTALAKRIPENCSRVRKSCNILGLTPLDFSLNGSVKSFRDFLNEHGWKVISTWAMETTLEDMRGAGGAEVNIVASASGIAAARVLKERFGTPYVVGLPVGKSESDRLLRNMSSATGSAPQESPQYYTDEAKIAIIGEAVTSKALAACIRADKGRNVSYICPLQCEEELLSGSDIVADSEQELEKQLRAFETVIADPLYKPIIPENGRLVRLPHEAFSGRMYSNESVNLISDFEKILSQI